MEAMASLLHYILEFELLDSVQRAALFDVLVLLLTLVRSGLKKFS